MKHFALMVLVILLASSVFGQVSPATDSTATQPVENTIVADPAPSDTTTLPPVVEAPVPADTTTTPAVVAEPVVPDTITAPAVVAQPVPVDSTAVPAVVAAPLLTDTSVTQAATADTLLTDTTAMTSAIVADTLLTDTTALVKDTLATTPKSMAPAVVAAAVIAAPPSKPQTPAAPPTQLELYHAMYDTLKTKVFKYDFKPERVSVLLDSLRMSREKSIAGFKDAQTALLDTVGILKIEQLGLQANADSLTAVRNGRVDLTVVFSHLRELKELLDQEVITQLEFNHLKQGLIQKLHEATQ